MGLLSFGICVSIILITIQTTHGFKLTVVHTNDIRARIEQMDKYGGTCESDEAEQGKCYGGVARRYTKINEIRADYSNVIFLDGGNQFHGTLWFNYYRGNATAYFNNKLNYSVGGLGNHEFDEGHTVLARYMKTINFPLVACNLDTSREPLLNGLYKSSVVLNVGGEKIGVTGYISMKTAIVVPQEFVKTIAFTNEIECLKSEVKKFQDQGINKIIALGHSDFKREIEIAKQVPGIDVLVGGISNTFLYNGDPPSDDVPVGPYPYVVTNDNGERVYIVQDYAYGKYLGFLQVTFDQQGVVINATGNPILLDSSIKQDPVILKEVESWAEPINIVFDVNIGETYVTLDGSRSVCWKSECNLGNLIADAVLYEHLLHPGKSNSWSQTSVAIWNSGNIRTSLYQGPITYGTISNVLPFRNEIQSFKILGKYIIEILEHSAKQEPGGAFLQLSGITVTYNLNNPIGNRVIRDKVMIRCSNCTVPTFESLDENAMYGVVSNAFIMDGGDGYEVLKEHAVEKVEYSIVAVDGVRKYIEHHSPIITGVDGRIFFQDNPSPRRPVNAVTVPDCQYITLLLAAFCSFSLIKY